MIPVRLWAAFGFRECHARPLDESSPGFSPGWAGSCCKFKLSIVDRIRLIISGKIMVDVATQMDVMPGRMVSTSVVSILPPGHKVEGDV